MYTNINEYVGDTNIITLTLIDTLGCKNVIFDTIFLHPSPLVEFSIESLCEDELPLILDDNTQWSNNINPIFLELGSYIQTIGQLNGPPMVMYFKLYLLEIILSQYHHHLMYIILILPSVQA